VTRGFSQIYGINYLDAYTLVIKLAFIRILLAIVAIFDFEIYQMDVVTVFLAEELKKKIYMKQPERYEMNGKNMVCRLIKSLYGLKQA
jgi:hypothetical protein